MVTNSGILISFFTEEFVSPLFFSFDALSSFSLALFIDARLLDFKF